MANLSDFSENQQQQITLEANTLGVSVQYLIDNHYS